MICKYCGAEIDDKAVLCVHCGKTVEKEAAERKVGTPTVLLVFLWICFLPIMAIVTVSKSKKLSKKAKTLSIVAIIIFSVLAGFAGLIDAANTETMTYETIVTSVEKGDYETAQHLIEDFMRQFPNSEHLSEISAKKEIVDAEILKIENEKKAKEEQERLEKEKEGNAQKANISVNAFENMLAACETIGINYGDISNIRAKDDWAKGKRCAFDYSEYQFLVYFNQDETVNSINSGAIKFYENGKKVEDLESRLITTKEKTQIQSWAEDNIKKILKSPSSAKFPGGLLSPFEDWSFSKNGTKYTVSSYVDSQNGFGAMMRSEFTITYEWKGETGKLTSLIFDGEKVF